MPEKLSDDELRELANCPTLKSTYPALISVQAASMANELLAARAELAKRF